MLVGAARLGTARGQEIEAMDSNFLVMMGFLVMLLMGAFVCGAFFSCWLMGWKKKKVVTDPWTVGYVTKSGKYIHLNRECSWLNTAKSETEVPVCPRCLKSSVSVGRLR